MQLKGGAAVGKGKSPNALKTIREAAEILDVPQHVLRFWETKFPQIKPLKRSGGRRYYRPEDINTLQQIHHLLYNQGYTISGALKAFDREIIEEVRQTFSPVAKGEPVSRDNDNQPVPVALPRAAPEIQPDLLSAIAPKPQPVPSSPAELADIAAELRALSAELRK